MGAAGIGGHLTTLEGEEHQFSLASPMLKARYGDLVSCIHGLTQDQLPLIAKVPQLYDFVFHDAGHTRDDYVKDFDAFVGSLKQGAIVLIDDINWDDRRWNSDPSRAHEGWLEVVSHQRVKRAVEIDGEMGLIFIS